jgi:hypothetical protein
MPPSKPQSKGNIDMNASDELRSLSVAEISEVSGAKVTTYDLGILGQILLDTKGCWQYGFFHFGSDGSMSSQTRGECSPPK